VAPDLSQSPEIQGVEEVVELPVRVPIEALQGEPIEPPDAAPDVAPEAESAETLDVAAMPEAESAETLDVAAMPEAESAETLDVAAMPEAVGRFTAIETPTGEAAASESDPGNDFFGAPVKATEPPQADAAARPGLEPVRAAAPAVADPATEIRFARLHLRTGSLHQARSEYESLAGNNLLDTPATLDLAEVRWRTGDLAGAGSAAAAYLAADGQGALGFLIAAEAAAAQDHMADAHRLAGQALERSLVNLEVFFAGVPRRMTWPESTWTAPAAMKIDASSPAFTPDRAAPSPVMGEPLTEAPEGSLWARTKELPAPEPEAQLPAAASHLWGGEVAAGAAALRAGDALMAALHFAVALRMTPESARAVVDGIGERQDLALELVRGDALRLLGNGSGAGEAYASVESALSKPRVAEALPSEPAAPEPAAPPPAAQAPASGPAAPQPAAQAPAVQQASAARPVTSASEPAVPASKVASTPEPPKKAEVDEPPAIRWE
jgi:hypothetical protein